MRRKSIIMTKYESNIKTIFSSEEMVFNLLGDLNNLELINSNPQLQDKVKDYQFDKDSCSFNVEGMGKIGFRINERIPFSLIKFISESSPIPLTGKVLLSKISENETSIQLIFEAKLPAMIKMMLDKKLKVGINTVADALAKSLNENNIG